MTDLTINERVLQGLSPKDRELVELIALYSPEVGKEIHIYHPSGESPFQDSKKSLAALRQFEHPIELHPLAGV